MVAPLQHLLITVKVFSLEKVSSSDTHMPGLFVNTLIADDKHYLLNRDNLTQPIQVQLSQKQKAFSQIFFAFLKSGLNFQHFPKKYNPHS